MPTRTPSQRSQPCEICDSTQFELLAERDRRGKPLATVVCTHCGIVSHEQIPTELELETYYRDQYRDDYNGESTPSDYRVYREWQRGGEILEKLRPFTSTVQRVLEIGSGIGCTVKQFELDGFEAYGLEPGEGFCDYSRRVLRAKAEQGRWQDISYDQPFDLIMLVHVLEHLRDPREVFQFIKTQLAPNGQLYVEVPNFGAPHAAPAKLFHYAHIYNYNQYNLKYLAEQCGYDVVDLLNGPHDRNLRMLFIARGASCGEKHAQTSTAGYQLSCEAFDRFNTLTYHLRPTYLVQRSLQMGSRVKERLVAKQMVRDLLERCEALSPQYSREAA